MDTAHADSGSHIALGQFRAESFEVVQRKEGRVSVGVDGSRYLRIVRHFDGERRAAVEGVACGQHTAAARVERRQFQRVLIGFGAGVNEKELVVIVAAQRA